MIEPKIKARELVDKFWNLSPMGYDRKPYKKYAKKCAIIACEEMENILFQAEEDADFMFPKEIVFIRQVIEEIKS